MLGVRINWDEVMTKNVTDMIIKLIVWQHVTRISTTKKYPEQNQQIKKQGVWNSKIKIQKQQFLFKNQDWTINHEINLF